MLHDEFVVDDFKLALSYLQGQFQRLWQRFSFFLTVQLALFGFIGALTLEHGKLNAIPLICSLGVVVSAIWYVVAAEDRFLVKVYRDRVRLAAARINDNEALNFKGYVNEYIGIEAKCGLNSLLEWYWRPVSITRLPAWLAFAVGVVWVGLMLHGKDWLMPFLPPASVN
jgi:hypothetical protein